jgi:hypothetical protein
MWSLLPVAQLVRRVLRVRPGILRDAADRTWEIAPSEKVILPKAYILPNQLERVTGTEFGAYEDQLRSLRGGAEVEHMPTLGFLLKDVVMIDGVLYKDGACSYLERHARRLPRLHIERKIRRGALYCSLPGNEYFGNWLLDDCVTYPLASAEGPPVTTHQTKVNAHGPGYEAWLDMDPVRVGSAFFEELVIFQDIGQNRSKETRSRALREKLLAHVERKPCPGVFIVRGRTGQHRRLQNEMEIAMRLQEHRGFRVLDPANADVATIVTACADARVVVGVEGSGLAHGILLLRDEGAVLTLEPPNRFCSIYKDTTDRGHQHYGCVVGVAEGEDFRIDPSEVEQTIDLFPPLPEGPRG